MKNELRQGITGDFFDRIRDKEVFEAEVFHDFYDRCEEMGVEMNWNTRNAFDAFFEWKQDLVRLASAEERIDRPDHLKCAAYLIYWLSRSSPAANFTYAGPETERIEFMVKYGREFLAFDLGYRAAQLYETRKIGRKLPDDAFPLRSALPDMDPNDFIETVAHVLKLSTITPSALLLVLKAVFLRP